MPGPSPDPVEMLFLEAVELSPEERGLFLDEHCAGDSELRAAVEELLRFDTKAQNAPDFLHSPAAIVRAALPVAEREPASFSHYRIKRLHGEGGMGTVYEAEQDNPRRSVALKVIRPGLVSAEIVKRFRDEAQILARLNHPGIAQVYESGMTDDGRPFFAMEFISGVPLDRYARDHNLDAQARLNLLSRVCDAVQHAHNKGIIHRDLKPGNILVDESGQPKVLDFGVAHVTDADLLTVSSQTQAGQLLGTLSYMSPEQIAGNPADLDGRSDVYTLGVILFELLAQRLPYQLDALPVHEVARVIQREEPSRLGSIDAHFRGDVEIMVAKALEKEKSRRFASAGDLASDIRRYLRGEAILSRPASALYQLRKFARRNKAIVTGVAGIFAALLVGTVVSLIFAVRARENARVANKFAASADEHARIAAEKERGAIYQTYRARIAAAVAAIARHDVADAARQLGAAPEEWRDWEWRHLRLQLDDSIAVVPAAAGESQFLIDSPEGLRVAATTRESLRITDLKGNQLLTRSFRPVSKFGQFLAIATRPGLSLVGTRGANRDTNSIIESSDVSNSTSVILMDEGGTEQTTFEGPPGTDAHLVAVSPDCSWIAVCWAGKINWSFTVYDLDSGQKKTASTDGIGFVHALVFSPDGSRIATAGSNGVTGLWDTSTGTITAQCRGHTLKVLSVAFRPDGRRLMTTSADGTVREWDAQTGLEIAPPYDRHTGEVTAAAYSPDGLWVASGGTDRTVRVWQAATRQEIAVLHGHTGDIHKLAFTADGRQLASVSAMDFIGESGDGTARLWELGHQAGRRTLQGHISYVYPVAFSPDGQWIASGSWDHKARLWDALTGECCAILPHPNTVRALAFSPDSARLVSGCTANEMVFIWNVATAQCDLKLKLPGNDATHAIAVSPDGAQIATANYDGRVSIVSAATGERVHSFRMDRRDSAKRALAYSPDGRLLAGTGEDLAQIDIWDAQSLHRSAKLTGHTGTVYSVAFSSDGRRLASAGSDRTVRVWDVATAKCLTVITGHTNVVFATAFHPDGKRLASAGRDRAIWLWDVATGQEMARLEGHTNYVFSLAFSPDGTSLVSGSGDGTVRIWDTEPPARRLEARREAAALRPEAERLVAGLFAELREPDEVVARLRGNANLAAPLRRAALREVMRRGQQAMP
jgi:WD40 repeat protein/predicted Ser/Thr protein kinase